MQKNNIAYFFSKTPMLFLLALLPLSSVSAQEAGSDHTPESKQGFLEEITVTATKREQNLQEVPIAITALSKDLLEKSGVSDIRQLISLTPSLYVTSTQSETAGTTARIRGIGTTGDNPGLESAVGVFIDGVYRSRNTMGLTELGELERIEVLRGPQGTLFGRNTSAGLIQVITKGPEFEPAGYGVLSAGNYDFHEARGGVTGTLVEEVLAGRLDIVQSERDGFFDDIGTGDEYNDRDRLLLRGQLLYQPTAALSFRFIADYAEREESCCAAVTYIKGPTAPIITALGGEFSTGDEFERNSATTPGRDFDGDMDEKGYSLEINWEADDFRLTSITSYRDWEASRSQDPDFTTLDLIVRGDNAFQQDIDTFTQELRISGETGRFNWLAGVYFSNEDITFKDRVQAGDDYQAYADTILGAYGLTPLSSLALPVLIPGGSGMAGDTAEQESDSWAVFTHNTYDVTDNLQLALGLRYTEEEKDVDLASVSNNPGDCLSTLAQVAAMPLSAKTVYLGLACSFFLNSQLDGVYSDDRKDEEVSGILSLSYDFAADRMAYVSYSKGYKAGGYNLDRAGLGFNPASPFSPLSATALEFDPETVDSYEIGYKSLFADGDGSLNLSYFYMEYDDFQLNSYNGLNFVVTTLSEVNARGVEIESTYLATANLLVQGGVSWNDTEYENPVRDSNGIEQTNLSGKALTNAPEWAVNGALTYNKALDKVGLNSFVHMDFRWTDAMNTGSDLDAEKKQEDFVVVNGRVGIGSPDESWQLELWGHNLFDEDYYQVAFDAALQTGTFNAFLAEPRTWGVTLRSRF